MRDDVLVVISHYAKRDIENLKSLLASISCLSRNILIVTNRDDTFQEESVEFLGFPALNRPNLGMNIGAWDSGYRHYPNFKYYIFLQDECVMTNAEFMSAYVSKLEIQSVGMIGESINHKWDKP